MICQLFCWHFGPTVWLRFIALVSPPTTTDTTYCSVRPSIIGASPARDFSSAEDNRQVHGKDLIILEQAPVNKLFTHGTHCGITWYSLWYHMVLIMVSHGTRYGITWYSLWYHMVLIMVSHGTHYGITWYSLWYHMVLIMVSHGTHYGITWYSLWYHMVLIMVSHGTHYGITWYSLWYHMVLIIRLI